MKNIDFLFEKYKTDAVIVSDVANIRYLSGFSGEGYLLFTENKKYVLTDFRYKEQAMKETEGFEVLTISAGGYYALFSEVVEKNKIRTACFEDNSCKYSEYKLFCESGIKEIKPLSSEIDKLRRVKNSFEISCIKKAESVGDKVFSDILGFIDVGMTETDVAAKIDYLLKVNGGEDIAFNTIVASGINSSMPHAVPSKRKISFGDFVTFDFGCKINGYCSDMTRTVVMGKASSMQEDIYGIVLEAQRTALENTCFGMTGKQIDALARDHIEKAGYGKFFGHATGHGVGIAIHELPVISLKGDAVIKENMVFSIEPGIYMPDFGGVRIEDVVYMTKEGLVDITCSDKKLIVL